MNASNERLTLKNMQFVIMVRKRSEMPQEMRWTRVNELRVGRVNTDSQRWSFVNFLRSEWEKRFLNWVRSPVPATGMIRSTNPSSSSTAIQRSQMKKYL